MARKKRPMQTPTVAPAEEGIQDWNHSTTGWDVSDRCPRRILIDVELTV
jgi:hypothetical protein